ncbi:hypothetical protein NDN08_007751 [Rhodosorus marinus]|uniref:Protein kinase domain-containing protein n=1 Tax=Rhodosorus marinus TaxID=101924 RepID=A0AAV8V2N4_9RHOD|nr:hypothetical protein NDN08_007751 [Rhodosorus marinus]
MDIGALFAGVSNGIESGGRLVEFWSRTSKIYLGFKLVQVENILLHRDADARDTRWASHHEWAAKKMYSLCVDMRGFFLKAGQFLGGRDDFFPEAYCMLLSTLQDRVPPMSAEKTRRAIEKELGGRSLEEVFSNLSLGDPLGSGTIAQVHSANLVSNSSQVAVKIQYPNAEKQMLADLTRLRILAKFLQKTELKFDILSAVNELSKEIGREFNFSNEAQSLNTVATNLQRRGANRRVEIPRPIDEVSTRRMLVMTFVNGTPMTQLKVKIRNVSERRRNLVSRKLLEAITDAYGGMILVDGMFQADPHPGNVMVKKDLSIGIVDFGQCKKLEKLDQTRLAKLVFKIHKGDSAGMISALHELGVKTKRIREIESQPSPEHLGRSGRPQILPEEKLARTMFDTRSIEGVSNSPFSNDSAIKHVEVETFPQQLYFVLRTVQILRGVAHGMGVSDFSVCDRWNKVYRNQLRQ